MDRARALQRKLAAIDRLADRAYDGCFSSLEQTVSNEADRRQHARVPYGAWVTLKAGRSKSFCLARDLSLGGLFLRSQNPPPVGSKISLVLVVEGEREPIKLKAHVVRLSEPEGGFAVRFDNMSEEAAAHLLGLVQSIHRQFEAALGNQPA